MKTLFVLFITAVSASAQTNYFSLLQVGEKTYTNATVRSVTAADVIVNFDGGGARVALSNLPPELQKQFGYDRQKALKETASIAERKAKDKAQYEAAGAQAAFNRNYLNALGSVRNFYEVKLKTLQDKSESSKARLTQLRQQLANLRAQRDVAWNRYIYTDSSYVVLRPGSLDNEANRYAYAQAMDRQISNTQDMIRDAEAESERAQNDYRDQTPEIKKEYGLKIAEVHEAYRGTNGPSRQRNQPTEAETAFSQTGKR